MTKLLSCPDCGSQNVTAVEEHTVMVNTYEHYCHSVKAHDDCASCECLDCEWRGKRMNLTEVSE